MTCSLRNISVLAGLGLLILGLTSCKSALTNYCSQPGNGISGVLEAGISLLADPFDGPDHVRLAQSDAAAMIVNSRVRPATSVTLKKELTLRECRSIALTNSLEIQQARIEQLTQKAIEYSNRTKLLPHFIFSGELSERDNLPFSFSELLGREGESPNPGSFGTGVNQYSTGRERNTWRYVLESRWSPTDAALAYYLTRSSRNDVRKHHHIRVRIAQKLVGVVDSSFFRLLSLKKIIPMAQRLVAKRNELVRKTEEIFQQKLGTVEDFHKAQQKLIKAEGLLASLSNEAEQQRNLLASAMRLSPDYCVDGGFTLVGETLTPRFYEPLCSLEMTAIRNRPEAYRASLDHLNSINDLKRTIVKFFPKLTGFWRFTRDDDIHLLNHDWKEIGALVYLDLLEWGNNYWEHKATELMAGKTRREIGAVALGISSQVRVAALRYYNAMDIIRTAEKSLASSRRVLKIQRGRTEKEGQNKLALMESEGDVLHEEIERLRAIGEAQGMLAELQSAMGTNYSEPFPG